MPENKSPAPAVRGGSETEDKPLTPAQERAQTDWVCAAPYLAVGPKTRGADEIIFENGDDCVHDDLPDNWPPAWLVEQGLVEPKRGDN